jgi:hypothetical protein
LTKTDITSLFVILLSCDFSGDFDRKKFICTGGVCLEELNNLYSLPNIVRVVKSRRMR